jgi:predicted ester cyclase
MNELAQNKKLILDFIQTVWREGDLAKLDTFWNENCINHAASLQDSKGLIALRAYHQGFVQLLNSMGDVEFVLNQQIAEQDLIVTYMTTKMRHTSLFMGLPATNKVVALSSMRIDRISNGKISEHWSIADMAGLMQQLQA